LDTDLEWLLKQARQEASDGRDVLVLTRRPRRWLERRHDLAGIDTIHFKVDKTVKDPATLNPENIGRIFTAIRDFLDRHDDALVIFDGAELLSFYNGFNFFIKLLYTINDVVWSSGGSVVFLVDPTTFHRRELHIIQKELQELRNPDSTVTIDHAPEG
jgi:two-component system cell cycle response regulator